MPTRTETLLNQTTVWLFGRELQDLVIDRSAYDRIPPNAAPEPGYPPRAGQNNFLLGQLRQAGGRLARVFGFSFEGHYYDMARPAIFLVHGEGLDPEGPATRMSIVERRYS